MSRAAFCELFLQLLEPTAATVPYFVCRIISDMDQLLFKIQLNYWLTEQVQ